METDNQTDREIKKQAVVIRRTCEHTERECERGR